MNRLHNWLCRSARWRKTIQQRVPWVLSGADLGPNVLELGPGPGLTTNLLQVSVQRLTAIELLAKSLSSGLRDSNVEVAWAMPLPCHFQTLTSLAGFRSPCSLMCPLQSSRTNCFARSGES